MTEEGGIRSIGSRPDSKEYWQGQSKHVCLAPVLPVKPWRSKQPRLDSISACQSSVMCKWPVLGSEARTSRAPHSSCGSPQPAYVMHAATCKGVSLMRVNPMRCERNTTLSYSSQVGDQLATWQLQHGMRQLGSQCAAAVRCPIGRAQCPNGATFGSGGLKPRTYLPSRTLGIRR